MKKYLLVIFLLPFIFFWQFIFKGALPIPADTIVGLYHPWRDLYSNNYPNGIPFKNFLITDPVRQLYPWRYLAIESLKNGKLPIWNPYNNAGTPLLSNLQSAVFYPLNFVLLVFPFEIGWSVLIFLQPLLGGLFLFLYLNNIRLRHEASLLGSIAFSFGGFFTSWLEWNTLLHVALYLPLILLSVDKILLIVDNKLKLSKLVFWGGIFPLALGLALFAGHAQTFFYLFMLVFIYLIVRIFSSKKEARGKIGLLFILCYLFFALITLSQYLPTAKFILQSAREIPTSWQSEGWFIPWPHLIQFFVPDFFGNPSTLNYWGTWNYGELIGYIGVIPLLFVFFALIFRKEKKTLFFGIVFFISLIFATPTFLAKLPYQLKLPFISTSQPTRLLFLVDFSLAVLSALGLDYFLKLHEGAKKPLFLKMAAVLVFMSLIYLGCAVFVLSAGNLISDQNLIIAKRNLLLPAAIFIFSGLTLLTIMFKLKKQASKVLLILIVITIFDLFRFSWKYNSFSEKKFLFPQTKITKFLQSQKGLFRVMTTDKRILPPNFSSVYKVQSIDGYDPLYLKDYGQFAAAWIRGKADITDFNFNRIINIQNFESRLTDLMNVKYILSLNDLQSEKLIKIFEEGQTKVYENKNFYPRIFLTEDLIEVNNEQEMIEAMFDESIDLAKTAIVYKKDKINIGLDNLNAGESTEIIDYQPNEVRIKTNLNTEKLLILSDVYYPSWKVYINGQEKKIHKVDYILRGVTIPKGKHEVFFKNSLW